MIKKYNTNQFVCVGNKHIQSSAQTKQQETEDDSQLKKPKVQTKKACVSDATQNHIWFYTWDTIFISLKRWIYNYFTCK